MPTTKIIHLTLRCEMTLTTLDWMSKMSKDQLTLKLSDRDISFQAKAVLVDVVESERPLKITYPPCPPRVFESGQAIESYADRVRAHQDGFRLQGKSNA